MKLNDWLKKKLERRGWSIKEPKTIGAKYFRALGPRAEEAEVVIYAEPSDSFEFKSEVDWPEKSEEYNAAVLEGLLDETLATDFGPNIRNVSFTLKSIVWHEIYSNRRAFYHAARKAVIDITEKEHFYNNIDTKRDEI